MIKTCAGDLEHLTTSPQPESSPSSAPCPCVLTKAGIKYSSIFRTSHAGPTEAITLRLLELPFMLIAVFVESISLIDCTQKKNFHLSSNCSCLFKSSNDLTTLCTYFKIVNSNHFISAFTFLFYQ